MKTYFSTKSTTPISMVMPKTVFVMIGMDYSSARDCSATLRMSLKA
jgi:hypothetical protein